MPGYRKYSRQGELMDLKKMTNHIKIKTLKVRQVNYFVSLKVTIGFYPSKTKLGMVGTKAQLCEINILRKLVNSMQNEYS